MSAFEIIYSIKENEKKIKLFNPDFVNKNKNKFKFIYNNKIYPLQNEFFYEYKINIEKNKKFKIILICYINFFNIMEITKECESFVKFNKLKKYRTNKNKYSEYLKCSFYGISKMIYKIEPGEDKIKIFGFYFVEKNKDKCIIIYKDKIFPLKVYFSINDIDKEDYKLEIILIELDKILDKSYMFYNCSSLEEFPLSKEEEKKELKNSEKLEESFEDYTINNTTSIFESHSLLSFSVKKSKWCSCLCTNMSFMFAECSSLISLPNLSNWSTENVVDMSYLFLRCTSLTLWARLT